MRTIHPWKRPNKTIWDTLKFTGNRLPPHCFLYHFHHSCVPKNKNTPGGSCWIYGKTQSANWLGRIIRAIPWDMFFTFVSCKQTTSTLQLLSKFLILWRLSLSFKPPNIPQKDLFIYFLIGNKKIFIKKKLANLSTLGMYCGGKNQEPKLLWSSKAGREKHEKCDKATLQTKRVCKKKT